MAEMIDVCPTYVGMNRGFPGRSVQTASMPHVCGDEPKWRRSVVGKTSYAPRMWG